MLNLGLFLYSSVLFDFRTDSQEWQYGMESQSKVCSFATNHSKVTKLPVPLFSFRFNLGEKFKRKCQFFCWTLIGPNSQPEGDWTNDSPVRKSSEFLIILSILGPWLGEEHTFVSHTSIPWKSTFSLTYHSSLWWVMKLWNLPFEQCKW